MAWYLWDAAYDAALQALYRRYPSSEALALAAPHKTRGGA